MLSRLPTIVHRMPLMHGSNIIALDIASRFGVIPHPFTSDLPDGNRLIKLHLADSERRWLDDGKTIAVIVDGERFVLHGPGLLQATVPSNGQHYELAFEEL